MQARRSRWILPAALLLSLLLHAVVMLAVHGFTPSSPGPREIVTHARVLQIVHATPRPLRTPPPRIMNATKTAPHPTLNAHGKPRSVATAKPPPTPQPTPIPSAPPPPGRCEASNVAASMLTTPPPPDIPLPVRADAASGITRVTVDLNAQGVVTGTIIQNSSGSPSLDIVAVEMARAAQYSPGLVNCKPAPAVYNFSVKFVAW